MLSLSHIQRMTVPIGMFEHCRGFTPDPAEGLTTDDNARALQLMLRLQKPATSGVGLVYPEQSRRDSPEVSRKLLPVYFRFLTDAGTGAGFHNERLIDGTWEDEGGIGDWLGRAMLALADTAVLGPEKLRVPAQTLFDEKIPCIKMVGSIHTIALLLEAVCQRANASFI